MYVYQIFTKTDWLKYVIVLIVGVLKSQIFGVNSICTSYNFTNTVNDNTSAL